MLLYNFWNILYEGDDIIQKNAAPIFWVQHLLVFKLINFYESVNIINCSFSIEED